MAGHNARPNEGLKLTARLAVVYIAPAPGGRAHSLSLIVSPRQLFLVFAMLAALAWRP